MSIHHLQKFKHLPGIDQTGSETFETVEQENEHEVHLLSSTPPSSPLMRKLRHQRGVAPESPSKFNESKMLHLEFEETESSHGGLTTPKGSRFSPKRSGRHGITTEGVDETSIYPLDAFQYFDEKLVFRPGGGAGARKVPGVLHGQYEYEMIRPRSSEEDTSHCRDGTAKSRQIKETPLAKFHRLQFEMKEFMNEVDAAKKRASLDPNQVDNFVDQSVRYSDLEDEIKQLHVMLSTLEESDLLRILGNPSSVMENTTQQQQQQDMLSRELANYSKPMEGNARPSETSDEGNVENVEMDKGKRIVYELYSAPQKENLNQVAKFVSMEKRIAAVEERVVGMTGNKALSSNLNLHDVAKNLERRMALLSDDTIDAMKKKAESTNASLKKLSTEHLSEETKEHVEKVNQLFDKMQKWDSHMDAIPLLIDRLEALKHVHDDSISFSDGIKRLQQQQSDIQSLLQNEESVLTELNANFQENLRIVESNTRQLDERMTTLMDKLRQLDKE